MPSSCAFKRETSKDRKKKNHSHIHAHSKFIGKWTESKSEQKTMVWPQRWLIEYHGEHVLCI